MNIGMYIVSIEKKQVKEMAYTTIRRQIPYCNNMDNSKSKRRNFD